MVAAALGVAGAQAAPPGLASTVSAGAIIAARTRIVDGAVGARFMNRLIEYLSEPSRLILEMA